MALVTVTLSILVLMLFCLLAVPFLVLGAVLGVVLFVVGQVLLLPFRLLGWAAWGGAGIIVLFMKAAVVVLLGLFVMMGLVIGLAPLLPLVVIVAGIWLLARSGRTRRGPAQARP